MSSLDHGSSAHLTTPSQSRPASKAHSVDQDLLAHAKPTRMATLNVLFLGETTIGESSITDLIGEPAKQKRTPRHVGRRAPSDDVRSVTLGGKTFILHSSPTSESMSPVALREGIRNTLMGLRKNGGIHLLVYCMNTLHSTRWLHEVHRNVAPHSTQSPPISVVAVIAGMSDVAQQESWWSSNVGALADKGPHFDDYAFIRTTTSDAQSPTGDDISENRHILHALILRNCAHALNPETDSDFQRTAPYKQRSVANSFQSLFVTLAGKPPSLSSASPKAINVVLLGEIGVGKSSLINLIARENVAGVSSDTVGCTKTATKYTFEEKGRTFYLYDTPGLVDPQMGVERFVDPIDTIQKLICSLSNENGPDLLLFCVDNSKPTAALQRNYRLFCKIICESKVPFALVIMKLEKGQDADQWWSHHGATIRGYGIDCSGHVGFGREKRYSDPNAALGGELRTPLLSFFVTCTDRQKNTIGSLRSSAGRMGGSVTSFLRSQVSTPERTLMNLCGLEEQTARELASRITSTRQLYGGRAHI